jgi:HD superfamily phosphodiesterase
MPPLPTLDTTTNRSDQRPKQVCLAAVCALLHDSGTAAQSTHKKTGYPPLQAAREAGIQGA